MKIYLTFSLFAGILLSGFSCQNKQDSTSGPLRNNYAVVWNWETTDQDHILKYLSKQTEELKNLWDKDIIENVYINTDAKFPRGELFPTISFVIKAKNKTDVKVYLDNMVFVKNKISSYQLFRVGTKYLGRNKAVLDGHYNKKAFVAIFHTSGNKKTINTYIQEHSEITLELWEKGFIENAYLNTDAFSLDKNGVPAIVYFVNAEDEKEAQSILAKLPFVQKNLTSYQIYPVGVFWLGQSESKND